MEKSSGQVWSREAAFGRKYCSLAWKDTSEASRPVSLNENFILGNPIAIPSEYDQLYLIAPTEMHFTLTVISAMLICITSAISIPPPLVLGQNAFNDNVDLHENVSSVGARNSRTMCYPSRYGSNLNKDSCIQAWEKMPHSYIPQAYTSRQQEISPGKVLLPLRYLSDDGTCANDVEQKLNTPIATVDVTTNDTIVAHAADLVEKCVQMRASGGYVGYFSK